MQSVQFLELNLMVMKMKIESGARFNLCVKHEFRVLRGQIVHIENVNYFKWVIASRLRIVGF